MRRLLPALAGLTLLLTACPRPLTPEVPMTDPKILSGRWAGEFVVPSQVSSVRAGAGVVYVLRASAGQVVALDARTGGVLARAARPQAQAIAYSPSGALYVLGGGKLTVHDPRTLVQTAARDVPGSHLSVDGEVASTDAFTANARVGTADGKPLPTSNERKILTDRSSDDVWWLSEGRALRAKDGLSSGGASGHGNPCALTSNLAPTSIESAAFGPQSGSAYLQGWSDGTIELRAANGAVQRTFKASATCSPVVDLYSDGRTVVYVTRAGEAGQINVQTGEASAAQALGSAMNLTVTPEGVSAGSDQQLYSFRPWGSAAYDLPAEPSVPVTLNVTATRLNSETASLTGSASVGGRTLTVQGTLRGSRVLLAQTSPVPSGLFFSVTLLDGAAETGSLTGTSFFYSSSQGPAYQSTLIMKGGATLQGELRRP
ncbi:hypothetical protein K7W42_18950 [Deinococcus sp. HMF7604]|uniref:hypothetical protein n=1 Tax=Deinococcus betulae TaxID=2873312 RepID=UPI001CCECADC|nr:hypothetical protein [Deinococcus betulae]MBZ9752920.1 hypothetical protein [Deinococcus betulae]